MLNRTITLSLFFILHFTFSFGQNSYKINGKITNSEGEALAFVAILPNDDPTNGVLSDIEGRFFLTFNKPILSLTFRRVGLETVRLDDNFLKKNEDKPLRILLKEAINSINEVVITAGENPANRIMRLVAEHRFSNNPERLPTFQCKTYNKLIFDLMPNDSLFKMKMSQKDTASKKVKKAIQNFENFEKRSEDHHSFLMETITERRFRFPNDNYERVLMNRVSGFKTMGVVALANMVQPFSFYDDFLRLIDEKYINPVSKGNVALYFFNIEDTLYAGVDTVFILSFRPKKGKVFEALSGVLHINSCNWAVQNVRAKPAFPNQMDIKIEQQYRFDTTATQWFPDQLNFELSLPKYPSPLLGMRVSGRSYITDVSINPPLRQRDFNPENPLVVEEDAMRKADSFWLPYRALAPLSIKEEKTYERLDSLAKKKNFAVLEKGLLILTTGKLPLLNGISLDVTRLIKTNNYENIRLGLGFTTAPALPMSRPKRMELGVYGGYGLSDSAFKYGGYALWRLMPSRQMSLQLSYANDLREPGAPSEFDNSGLVSRTLYANKFDKNEEISLAFSSRIGKRILGRLTFLNQRLQPNYDYTFVGNDAKPLRDFPFTEAIFYAKYVYDEPVSSIFGSQLSEFNRFPVVEFAFVKGFDKILKGQYDYQKWYVALYQSRMIRQLGGKLSWRIEAGKVDGNVPFAKLFTLNQGGNDGFLNFFAVNNTFQTLPNDTLWLSDRYINGYFQQSFGNILYRKKWSAPQLSIIQNVAYGTLTNPSSHQNLTYSTPRKPLLESGVVLDNLLVFNYLNFANIGLGAGVYYRWGHLRKDNWADNLRFRLSATMSL
jgi:Family of unknown function (DUF5686)